MKLYELNIYDLTGDYKEGFLIGIFSSYSNAEQTAKKMLVQILGFKDYDCKYEICQKKIIGTAEKLDNVYMICGWDEDELFDAVNIIESDLYIDYNEAKAMLTTLQEKYTCQEWCIDCYTIDKVLWEDGFIKV